VRGRTPFVTGANELEQHTLCPGLRLAEGQVVNDDEVEAIEMVDGGLERRVRAASPGAFGRDRWWVMTRPAAITRRRGPLGDRARRRGGCPQRISPI
jgi:hypothetical protein